MKRIDITLKNDIAPMVINGEITLCSFDEKEVLTGAGPSLSPITISQDKVALSVTGSGINSAAVFGASNIYFFRGGAQVFDLRVKDGSATTAEWQYYIDDVLVGGDRVLPPG